MVLRDVEVASPFLRVDALDLDVLDAVQGGALVIVEGVATGFLDELAALVSLAGRRVTGRPLALDPAGLSDVHQHVTFDELLDIRAQLKVMWREAAVVPNIVAAWLAALGVEADYLVESTVHARVVPPERWVPTSAPLTERVPSPAHRDVWYGLPANSINVWVAATPADERDGVYLHPEQLDRPLRPVAVPELNTVGPPPVELGPAAVPVLAPGDLLLFCGGRHLHGTLPNTGARTRVSFDYRFLAANRVRRGSVMRHYHFVDLHPELDGRQARAQVTTARRLAPRHPIVALSALPLPVDIVLARVRSVRQRLSRTLGNLAAAHPQELVRRIGRRLRAGRVGSLARTATQGAMALAADPDPTQTIFDRCVQRVEVSSRHWLQFGASAPLPVGDYFEFGVQDGDSMLRAWQAVLRHHHAAPPHWRLIGFDSFEGLPPFQDPADIHPIVGQGAYQSIGEAAVHARLRAAGVPEDHIVLVRGRYDEVLDDALKDRLGRPIASFVNIDCDYYSSARDALDWVEELMVDGTVVYFDDVGFYNHNPTKGVLLAIDHFNQGHDTCGLAPLPQVDIGGKVYVFWRSTDDAAESEGLAFGSSPG